MSRRWEPPERVPKRSDEDDLAVADVEALGRVAEFARAEHQAALAAHEAVAAGGSGLRARLAEEIAWRQSQPGAAEPEAVAAEPAPMPADVDIADTAAAPVLEHAPMDMDADYVAAMETTADPAPAAPAPAAAEGLDELFTIPEAAAPQQQEPIEPESVWAPVEPDPAPGPVEAEPVLAATEPEHQPEPEPPMPVPVAAEPAPIPTPAPAVPPVATPAPAPRPRRDPGLRPALAGALAFVVGWIRFIAGTGIDVTLLAFERAADAVRGMLQAGGRGVLLAAAAVGRASVELVVATARAVGGVAHWLIMRYRKPVMSAIETLENRRVENLVPHNPTVNRIVAHSRTAEERPFAAQPATPQRSLRYRGAVSASRH